MWYVQIHLNKSKSIHSSVTCQADRKRNGLNPEAELEKIASGEGASNESRFVLKTLRASLRKLH